VVVVVMGMVEVVMVVLMVMVEVVMVNNELPLMMTTTKTLKVMTMMNENY